MTASGKEILDHHTENPGFLYISNATPNIGYGPIDIYGYDSCFCGTTNVPCNTTCPNGDLIKHIVKQRIFQKIPGSDTLGYYDRIAGQMTYHPAHGHLHVDNWANYTLRTPTADPDARNWPIVGTGVKQSFCLINLGLVGLVAFSLGVALGVVTRVVARLLAGVVGDVPTSALQLKRRAGDQAFDLLRAALGMLLQWIFGDALSRFEHFATAIALVLIGRHSPSIRNSPRCSSSTKCF